MALLGKFFDALCSLAKRFVSNRYDLQKGESVKREQTDTKKEPSPENDILRANAKKIARPSEGTQESKQGKLTDSETFGKKARLIEHNGDKKTLREGEESLVVSTTAIRERLRKDDSIQAPDNSDKPIAKFKDIKLVKNENGTFIEADGKTYSLFQFSKVLGIKFGTLYGRVQKGWNIKEIISVPRDVKRDYAKAPPIKAKLWEWNGERHTVGEWAEIYGVQKAMMRKRLTTYGSPERNTDKLESYKKRRARRFAWNGETHTAKEWAEIFKVPVRTMFGRLKAHNSPEVIRKEVYKPPRKQYKFNGESHTAEEWSEKTKQAARTVKKHFRENGTPYPTFKGNSGHFKEKSYTWDGITKRASEWADEYNCTVNAIHKRFRKNGSPEPTGRKQSAHYFTFNGETHTYKEWGEKYGISTERMYKRIKRQGSPLPTGKRYAQIIPLPENSQNPSKYINEEESSDTELYWSDGDCRTIAEWSAVYGIPKGEVKENLERYGTPIKPKYDFADLEEDEDFGEREEDIDEILREIDEEAQQRGKMKKKETIHEWLNRIKNEPDDGIPLKEILGCLNPRSGR